MKITKLKVKSKKLKMLYSSILLLIFHFSLLTFSYGCSGCSCNEEEEPTKVTSGTILLNQVKNNLKNQQNQIPAGPRIRYINIGPTKDEKTESKGEPTSEVVANEQPPAGEATIPKDVFIDDSLTARLRDKLKEAYSNRDTAPPEIEIYTGGVSLEQFGKYYENRGYKLQQTSIPASQIVAPLLEQKPELASKIDLKKYEGIQIHQVIVSGANISAADKYIDPETYEIVNRTFVTVTKLK